MTDGLPVSAAVLSMALVAACADRDTGIRFLRSETHTFTRAEQRLISEITSSTVDEVRRVLPMLPSRIELTVRPGSDVMQETGAAATAMPPAGVMWIVDPSRPGGVSETTRRWLRSTLFHELHHLARNQTHFPESLVDRAVLEGLATAFERDFANTQPPWGQYSDQVELWASELTRLPPDAPTRTWIYSHPDGRRWIGMRVGTYWVDRASAKSGRSAADLVSASVDEILSLAGQSK